jgi:hypothetical protein
MYEFKDATQMCTIHMCTAIFFFCRPTAKSLEQLSQRHVFVVVLAHHLQQQKQEIVISERAQAISSVRVSLGGLFASANRP